MSVIVEAVFQNGAFKSAQPVSFPEGAKVRLSITPVEEKAALAEGTTLTEAPEQHPSAPELVWSNAIYRARKAAQEFSKETHADY